MRRAASIAWPAFLGASVLEMLVFSFVDPAGLHLLSGQALELSDTAVYSLAFFVFWAAMAMACVLSLALARSADEVNTESRLWRR
jgi:cytosine/uracil/thiamine/allantoin permease